MRVITYILSALIIINASALQSATLKGVITDKVTGSTLPGVTVVWLKDGKIKKAVASDASGEYLMEEIDEGEQLIQVTHIGYQKITKSIYISSPVTTSNFELAASTLHISPFEIIGYSEDKLKRVPGAATRLEPLKIDLIKPIGTQEILEYVPGVNAFSDDGMGNSRMSIGIRGLNPRRSSRILILEDGIPIQPAIYVYPNMYYNPPVERIDEIEVIKGSGAIKYGPQTMGGVINYITDRPRKDFGGEAQLTIGTNNYYSYFAEVGGWGSEKIQPEIQLLYKTGDGFRENNHFDQVNGTFKAKLLTSEKSNLYIKANVNQENSNATYTGLTEYSFASNPRFNPKKDDNFTVFRAALDLIYEKHYNDKLSSTSKYYVNHFNREWWRENDVFVDAATYNGDTIIPVPYYNSGNLIRTGNGKDNHGNLRKFYVLGYEKSYAYAHHLFKLNGNLEVGGRGHWERFIDDKKAGNSPAARDGAYFTSDTLADGTIKNTIVGQSHHYETTALSVYLMEKLFITEKLVITPGARFEGFEQERIDRLRGNEYKDKVTFVLLPGVGFNYEWKKLNLFGGIHKGYTSPSSGTLSILDFGANATESLDLKAETSRNTEVGVRGNLNLFSFEVAAFDMLINDIAAPGRGTALKNLGKVASRGVENLVSFHLGKIHEKVKFLPDFNVSYTYMQTEVLSGEINSTQYTGTVDIAGRELPYAPHHTLIAGLSKELGFGLSLQADVKYISSVYTDYENLRITENRGDQGPIDAYHIFNASARYIINDKWILFIAGKNLADTIYIGSRLHSNPGQPQANISSGIIPGAGRQISFGIKYQFGSSE